MPGEKTRPFYAGPADCSSACIEAPLKSRHSGLELPDGDTEPGGEVRLGSVLDEPAGVVQGLVNVLAGLASRR